MVGFSPAALVAQMGMDMTVKSLKDGRFVEVKAKVYYKVEGGVLVTRFYAPFKNIVYTNASGIYKMYDEPSNTVTLKENANLSSNNSFIYYFLSGRLDDLGLRNMGLKLRDTRIEEKMLIKEWNPQPDAATPVSRAELVYENRLPVFLGFWDQEGNPLQKVYYDQYQHVGDIPIPTRITEFNYEPEKDSTIVRKTYGNFLTNGEVPDGSFEFNVPKDAEILR